MKDWSWIKSTYVAAPLLRTLPQFNLVDGRGRNRATIWQNEPGRFAWHTWDEHGTGGENCEDATLNRAKDSCVAALVRQGWTPYGWIVQW